METEDFSESMEIDVALNAPLHRGFLPELRDQLVENGAIEHAAGDVLASGELASLDQQDLDAGLGQGVGGGAAGGAGADDDDLEAIAHGSKV